MRNQASLEMRMAIEQLPRVKLVQVPTPLVEAHDLSIELAGPRIFVKRDDLTGFAFGGTKGRMLEFHMGVARRESCDAVILYASAQSNYCRQLAAAASKLGMKAVLLLGGREDGEVQGNLLLDKLLGAEIRFVDHIDDPYSAEGIREFDEIHARTVDDLRRNGHRALVIDQIHRPSVWSIVGAIDCALELSTQLSDANLTADYLYVAVASGATYAGLLLGLKACGLATRVVGVTCSKKKEGYDSMIAGRARQTAELLGVDIDLSPDEVAFCEEYVGAGYGILSTEVNEAITLLARTEGIFLDPVLTGKALSGLIDQIRSGRIGQGETVVFLHTGGTPTLFAYNKELASS